MSGYDDLFKSHFPDRDSTPQGGTRTGSTGRGSNTGTRQYDSYESLRKQYFGNSGTETRREKNTGKVERRAGTSTRVTVRPEVGKPKKGADWVEKTGKTALSMLPDKGKFASEQTQARMNDPEAHYTDREWTLPTGVAGGAAMSAMTGARASALKTDPEESKPVSLPKSDEATGALGKAAHDPDFVGALPAGTRGTAANAQQRAQAHAQIANDAYTAQQNITKQYQDTQEKASASAQRAAQILAESGAVKNGDGSFTFPNAASARMFT